MNNIRFANMQIITFASQKGGVGKTTLAVNLAVLMQAAGLKTALFDLDPQESATQWAERRDQLQSLELPHVEPVSARRLGVALEAARAAGFQIAIIDTPPAAGEEALQAARAADLVLIPFRPSMIDLDAIKRTAALIEATGRPAAGVISSAPPTATQLLEDARTLAAASGIADVAGVIRERSAWRASWPYGLGVAEHEPKGKAASELAELQDFIFARLQITKPAKPRKAKVA